MFIFNRSSVHPEQGTELAEGPVSKGPHRRPFDKLRTGLRQAQPERQEHQGITFRSFTNCVV
jgi:hypothetical protein